MSARRIAVAASVGIATTTALTVAPALADGSRHATVSIIDNAFQRNVQRPTVRVTAGATVTWRWRSRQSHSVLVRSGPERFASTIRNHGTFTHRFTRQGTYNIICALHAPGMRMTIRVAR